MKKIILIVLIISLLVVSCSPENLDKNIQTDSADEPTESKKVMEETNDNPAETWMNIELTDVNSGNVFKISDHKGKKVLLESFAVWCPLCTKQQSNIKKLHEEIGDEVVSISIDTDPNEDAALVKDHAEGNGFDWAYAVAPKDFTTSLIDQFGNAVVNAPSAPVILVCEDGTSRKMPSGVKSVAKLKAEIAEGC
tara:strand:- start:55647 stop:56228 length:582 start_codon:yes stop_codon:yes gene_type:complete